jgi:hypothetical protein
VDKDLPWLQVRQPDFVMLWGWGVNSTAEKAGHRLPARQDVLRRVVRRRPDVKDVGEEHQGRC